MTRGPEDIPFTKLSPDAVLPTRAHPDDAGLDLYALDEVRFEPGEGKLVATGVAAAVPQGHVGMIADRSSLARRGLKTAGGIIDAGYRGEIGVIIWNISGKPQVVGKGDRAAQLLVVPVAAPAVRESLSLGETSRGRGGFGSTGR